MADVTLTLDGAPQSVTLATTTLRRIVVPAGTHRLECSSLINWYQQIDTTQATVDGAAITAANAQLIPAGLVVLGSEPSTDSTNLHPSRYVYAYGSSAGTLYVRAVSER